ncbi:hypothetical protein CY34DRAFT_726625 [Suillus luteus UH-Slu-Lm8-n1]|uniref:Uncharacterized protein n=1 Tax=Suillus luteus UH-Slu-Lm8-n1 TaxID=930992 RepID=A0A0D0AZJ9_9AGAM|nr:hypothetical protein CY34DRAFT_726625 [Suillus luteus UH-Slu-Lm8-n1]
MGSKPTAYHPRPASWTAHAPAWYVRGSSTTFARRGSIRSRSGSQVMYMMGYLVDILHHTYSPRFDIIRGTRSSHHEQDVFTMTLGPAETQLHFPITINSHPVIGFSDDPLPAKLLRLVARVGITSYETHYSIQCIGLHGRSPSNFHMIRQLQLRPVFQETQIHKKQTVKH